MSPSCFGRSGLSFLFRLVLPPSSDGCAGHSGFLFLFWLVSPPSSGGCVVSFLLLMRSAMSFCFWARCWPPLRHWFGLGALGRVRPLTCHRMSFSELVTAWDVSFPSRETHCWHPIRAFFWSASRRSTWGLADLPALVTDPDTWQELSQDSLLASSGSFRSWASGFLSLSWPITLSCATGATATMLTYWLWRQDQTLGRNSCLHSCTTILHGHSPRRCTRLSFPLLGPPPLAASFRRSTSSSLWRKSVSQWRGTGP